MSLVIVTVGLSLGGLSPAGATTAVWSTPVQVPLEGVSGPGGTSISSVSCVDATDCTAVGEDSDSQAFTLTETAGVWGTPTLIAEPPGFVWLFDSVSCSALGDCTAVGSDRNGPLYDIETNGVWAPPKEDLGVGFSGPSVLFSGVSCSSASDCTAVGEFEALGGTEPMYATETNGTWAAPVYAFSADGHLASISCVDADECTAVGSFLGTTDLDNNPNLATQAWATETNGTWGPLTAFSNIPSRSTLLLQRELQQRSELHRSR